MRYVFINPIGMYGVSVMFHPDHRWGETASPDSRQTPGLLGLG